MYVCSMLASQSVGSTHILTTSAPRSVHSASKPGNAPRSAAEAAAEMRIVPLAWADFLSLSLSLSVPRSVCLLLGGLFVGQRLTNAPTWTNYAPRSAMQ